MSLFANPDENEMISLRLDQLRIDGGTQPRAALDDATIEDYAQAMAEGEQFPPLTAFHDGETYWLADGFHRLAAARKLQRPTIAVEVHQGTRRDAVLYSVSANATHGLRRSNADKRRAVETLLKDDEWGKWSDREIARKARVSHTFVAKIRADLTGNAASEERVYTTKHGTTATMNTGAINADRPSKEAIEDAVTTALLKGPLTYKAMWSSVNEQLGHDVNAGTLSSVVSGLIYAGRVKHAAKGRYTLAESTADPATQPDLPPGETVSDQAAQPEPAPTRAESDANAILDALPRDGNRLHSSALKSATGIPDARFIRAINLLLIQNRIRTHGSGWYSRAPEPKPEPAPQPAIPDKAPVKGTFHTPAEPDQTPEQRALNYALAMRVNLEKGLLDVLDGAKRALQVKSIVTWKHLEAQQLADTRDMIARVKALLPELIDHLDELDLKLADHLEAKEEKEKITS